ncbi:ACP phosphodiesterase [Adhaeribacter aerolatus]|uniref:ACP phosphodiesterase n=1 Tax=Adhaeribacter aerolatus TaxID=670289 RepID=A0A512B4C7_9BACT|nr:ACP phosphodiesterase [Adhaeribacter aerolatus]GEO06810.1 ACP phosphodiesterase [Adhaeribacter aerolatus]
MNYLAHSFLSGQDEELLVGNFIADSVRGSQFGLFPRKIAQGIILHRQIDTFTDAHPVVQQSKERLRPAYRKYAGVIADIYYDHFLAINFDRYSTVGLGVYTQQVYDSVQRHHAILPDRVKYFLPYMIEQNWLLNYANLEGIRRSLTGLSRRTAFISNMETAADELRENYHLYLHEFNTFFPDLMAFVEEQQKL